MSDAARGKLTAWQRWEMDSFNQGDTQVVNAQRQREQQAAAEQLRAALEQARELGKSEGHAEGMQQGHEQGYREGQAQARQEAQRLAAVAASASAELARLHESMGEAMLDLALDIAKAMLKTALPARRELVLPVVQEALQGLAAQGQGAELLLNPADAALVREHLDDDLNGWRVREDSHVQAGGCILDTPANHVDASTERRWQRIAAALQRQDDWLA